MYTRIALAILLLWGVGYTQDSGTQVGTAARMGMAPVGSAAAARALRTMPQRSRSFANLPDQGNLVAYPEQQVVRRDGAYTWHRASLSEDHALKAVGGVMKVTTPRGEELQFQYERHVEHPSGDWTWIGRAKSGAASDEMVVTFGERAAFGSISQPGRSPLKLTMNEGTFWLIETDRSMIANIDNPATRPRSPDFLIPPKIKARFGVSAPTASTAPIASSTAKAQAAAATTVDVLLGYTTGFAAAQGGQSQAVTRLNNMVEIANQAYANSQVDARIRLVHAMQVSYPDNTSNDSTLEALTGFRAPSTPTTPDPAFAGLRAARNQYGADLVSLVRQFNTPENDGCGIAWLIGGGQTGIDSSDEYFGYSVVSDGRDAGTDGKTYFCREETLAHELGHNMGSQHDRATATVDGQLKYGVYPYSFGYKTGADTGNFYTVMAYGDSGQTPYRIFSNPRSVFCGAPCGITNEADNSRSLSQTMPIVAGFRSTVVTNPPAETVLMVCDNSENDFDGDGRADVLWRHMSDGWNVAWRSGNSGESQEFTAVPSQLWQVAGAGDFDGDGKSDVLWRHMYDGWNVIWKSGNSATPQELTAVPSQVWRVVGVGDFDGDGRADILWRHMSDGWNVIWRSGNSATPLEISAVPSQTWRVVGIGDFDGDSRADILWRHMSDGWNVIWRSGNSATPQEVTAVPSQIWRVVGIGDFSGDGRSDILWRHMSDGWNLIWRSGNSATPQEVTAVPSQIWQVAGVGDFRGDGRSDILWRHMSDGWNVIWTSANSANSQDISAVPSQVWQTAGACRRDGFFQ